jgi:mycothiol synthase
VDLSWVKAPLTGLDQLIELAQRCLDADGGLPLAVDPGFLRRRWTGAAMANLHASDAPGTLIAAGAVRPSAPGSDAGDVWAGGATFVGMVDPRFRGRGLGSHLLDWGVGHTRVPPTSPVTVETESLTPEGSALFASRGLRQVFAEDVMRIDVAAGVPEKWSWPAETLLEEWSGATAERFFRVYDAAFRERPGFPGWPAAEWISDLTEDDEFRPSWSVLASLPGLGEVGFVTAAVGWIVQVGVAPVARGRGIGGALVAEALRRMRADGAAEAWLNVNVDNSAVELYRRLGFAHRGRRARFQRPDGSL